MSSSMYLTVYRENFYSYIGEITRNISAVPPNWKTAVEISSLFRRMGVSCLFIDDDIKSLFSYLNDSGNSFLYFLDKIDPQDLVTSKFDPFFDALACKNYQLAKQIALMHPRSCNKNYEYQEEFYYFHFLMEFIQGHEKGVLINILNKYDEVLDGNSERRFDICKALLEPSVDDFEENLISLIQEWEVKWQTMQAKELIAPDIIETEGNLFIEGIALLRIAEKASIQIDNTFSYMPQDVLDFTPGVYDDNSWKYVAID